MKRGVFCIVLTVIVLCAVSAQTTKVSKQISVLPWLNTAVIDANEAAGGLHTYADWTALSTSMKTAQVKIGMLITILADKATYRLKKWDTTTALPLKGEWERVGDMIVVDNITARNALIVTDNSKVSLAPGTTVIVKDNGSGLVQSFIYAASLFDANGDGTIDTSDVWYSATSTAGMGYVLFDEVEPNTTAVTTTNGWDAGASTPGIGSVAAAVKYSSVPSGVAITLTTGTTKVPQIAVPAAWANPVFYIYDGTTASLLTDCWTKSKATVSGVVYQVWVPDFSFLKDISSGTYKLYVR